MGARLRSCLDLDVIDVESDEDRIAESAAAGSSWTHPSPCGKDESSEALGDTRSFTFRARVRGVELEAIDLVRFNELGQIVELKVFIRPLPGLATLFAVLPPRVSARRRGRLSGALVASLARPLAFALRTADRLAPRFL